MRVIEKGRKVAIINGLCNGLSLRAASRLFNTHRTAIQNLLVRVGVNCDRISAERMVGLECKYLELDELWTFCGKKERRLSVKEKRNPNLGDQYVFFAIDNETKLIPAWVLGKRISPTAVEFLRRLKNSLNGHRPQVSTDDWRGYADAIDRVFGIDVHYGTISKQYEKVHVGPGRYAPPRVSGAVKSIHIGEPDRHRICTSIIERSNLTVRTMQRRFTRLSLGFSRKMVNLRAAVSLHFGYYNYVWQPRTLGGLSPAMAAGITDRLWDVADLVGDC